METILIQDIPRNNDIRPVVILIQSPSGYRQASVEDFIRFPATSGEIFSTDADVSGQLILPANETRRGAYFYNNSPSLMFVGFASGISSSNFTFALPPSGAYELPLNYYNGNIYGIWESATGQALVTELR